MLSDEHVTVSHNTKKMRTPFGLYGLLLGLGILIAFVNPVRNALTADDSWAYCLGVRHLLHTGEYRLHDWAGVNMPVQIYLGTFLAKLFGYSFTLLRFSTIMMLFVAVVSLYCLLRDFDAGDAEAALVSAAVATSPLIFFLSFTFQTDVQFLGWELLAVCLYSRAIRSRSYLVMAMGSIAAAAAIGTRQFGVALLAGLVMTWLCFEDDRRRKLTLYVTGLVLPLVMTCWQIAFSTQRPTFSEKLTLDAQWEFLRDWHRFIGTVFWRPAAILQYLGIFLLTLLPLALMVAWKQWRVADGDPKLSRLQWWLLAVSIFYITVALCYQAGLHPDKMLMPTLPWLLGGILEPFFPPGRKVRLAVTILSYAFAVTLVWSLCSRYLANLRANVISRGEWFVVCCAAAAFGLQCIYLQLHDVYVMPFVPFIAFVLSRISGNWSRPMKTLTLALCLCTAVVCALWTRENLSHAEARWKAAEIAGSDASDPNDVAGNMTWSCYHGAFDEWVAQIGGPQNMPVYHGGERLHPGFFDHLAQQYDRAHYVVSTARPESGWQVLAVLQYQDRRLRSHPVYVSKKLDSVLYPH
jgi:Dolichyl-phosphate-mannose-protein mannosyltransferase